MNRNNSYYNKNRKKSNTRRGVLACLLVTLFLVLIVSSMLIFYFINNDGGHDAGPVVSKKTEKQTQEQTKTEEQKEYEAYYEPVNDDEIAYDDGVLYVKSHLLVTAEESASYDSVKQLIEADGGDIIGFIEMTNDYQVNYPEGKTYDELLELKDKLGKSDLIKAVYLEYVFESSADAVDYSTDPWQSTSTPGDSMEGWCTSDAGNSQSAVYSTTEIPMGTNWWSEAIGMPAVWNANYKLSNVNVGLIDSFFDTTNNDLADAFADDGVIGQDGVDVTAEYNDAVRIENKRASGDYSEDKPAHSSSDLAHGTVDCGIIAARNNDFGVCGINQKATLYGISLFGNNESWNTSTMAYKYGIEQLLVHDVKVISISMGYVDVIHFAAQREEEGRDNRTDAALRMLENVNADLETFLKTCLEQNDFLITKAAGNSSNNYFKEVTISQEHPYGYTDASANDADAINEKIDAKYDFLSGITDSDVRNHILVVGALDERINILDDSSMSASYAITSFSNIGDRVDIYSPGGSIYERDQNTGEWLSTGIEILSSYPNQETDYMQGTSQATPMVAGVASLIWSKDPDCTSEKVRSILMDTAISYTDADQNINYKMLNARTAMESAPSGSAPKKKTSGSSRDIAMVLDCSGSMSGTPMEETKSAASSFVDTAMTDGTDLSLITYSETATVVEELTEDSEQLHEDIENIYAGGGTNIYDGLQAAYENLEQGPNSKKIVVLMSDGLPNYGTCYEWNDYSTPLVELAEKMKDAGYYIYTLGFFSSVSSSEITEAQQLMQNIASPGLHYEVRSEADLTDFFNDIASQIGGQKYVYIRVACPVNVSVTYDGETLSSDPDSENTRTDFGTLTYENVEDSESEDGYDSEDGSDTVKILRLKMDHTYKVDIEGYDEGTMDYSISYPDEDGKYTDTREFNDIDITATTKAMSHTIERTTTQLSVDRDGDGNYEAIYANTKNGTMYRVVKKKSFLLPGIIIGVCSVVIIGMIIYLAIYIHLCRKRKEEQRREFIYRLRNGYILGVQGNFKGNRYLMKALRDECVVGRSRDCSIQINSPKISKHHCIIRLMEDGNYQIIDLSSNGIYINNRRVIAGRPIVLARGTLVYLGNAENIIQLM